MCHNCSNDAMFTIVLDDGECFEVCSDCIPETIKTYASTNNAVHSIESINGIEELRT